MITVRCVRRFGAARAVDAITAAELRAWLLELRATLSPESIAGYVRGLKAFGNWCATEEIATAAGFRALRRPKVPRRLIAPFSDPELRSLLALADDRERALALVFLDTGLRLSELASLRVGDVRPDGTLHVMGKGARGADRADRLDRPAWPRPLPRDPRPGPAGRPTVHQPPPDRAHGSRRPAGDRPPRTTGGRRDALQPAHFRHTFARGYLVNGGDVFSLQQILGHTTLDMVRRYVALSEADLVARHRAASPADRLVGIGR